MEKSVQNKLLTLNNIKGAERILVNVYGGPDIKMEEVTYVGEHIKNLTGKTDSVVYFGVIVDPKSTGKVEVTLIATGFSSNYPPEEIIGVTQDVESIKTPEVTTEDDAILRLLLENEDR